MKNPEKFHEPLDLVIFDFDGTLIDSKYDIATSVNLTLKDLGLPVRSTEEIFSFVGDGVKHLLRLSVGEDNHEKYEEALTVFLRSEFHPYSQETRHYYSVGSWINRFQQ